MPNIYEMSDEELSSIDLETLSTVVEEEPKEEDDEELEEQPEVEDTEAESEEADNESETEADDDEDFEQETPEDSDESEEVATNDEDNAAATDSTPDNVDNKNKADGTDEKETTGVDYEDFYKQVTAKFKAVGKDVQISDPSDIMSLMQQGIGYSQKMAGLKPIIAIGKTLKEHGLDDPAKVSYLIDLHNKDPKAIAKLIKESGTDLYEFDVDAGDDYVASNKVREETKLQTVMDDLSHSDSFNGLIDTVASEWDDESKKFIIDNPNVLRVLSQQVDSGLYAQINDAIEYQRMVGKLRDMPYIEAYSYVESQLAAQGKPQAKPENAEGFKAPRPKPKAKGDNSKKRKATSPQSGASAAKETFNPLEVSDEELLKIMNQQTKF